MQVPRESTALVQVASDLALEYYKSGKTSTVVGFVSTNWILRTYFMSDCARFYRSAVDQYHRTRSSISDLWNLTAHSLDP